MDCLEQELRARIVAYPAGSKQVRRWLARRATRLARDLVLLTAGLRPAVLIDYLVEIPSGLFPSLLQAAAAATEGRNAHLVRALRIEEHGCTLLLRPDLTTPRLRNVAACATFVDLRGPSEPCVLSWADNTPPPEVLASIQRAVDDLLLPSIQRTQSRQPGEATDAAHEGAPDVSRACRAICLPVLLGLLLGYPFCHLVEDASVERACRTLTDCELAVVRVAPAGAADGDPDIAFSVPSRLLPDGLDDPRIRRWWGSLKAAATWAEQRGLSDGPLTLQLHTKPPGQPVVL